VGFLYLPTKLKHFWIGFSGFNLDAAATLLLFSLTPNRLQHLVVQIRLEIPCVSPLFQFKIYLNNTLFSFLFFLFSKKCSVIFPVNSLQNLELDAVQCTTVFFLFQFYDVAEMTIIHKLI
jgi:hypothetical protein